MTAVASAVAAELAGYVPEGGREQQDWEELCALVSGPTACPDPFLRTLPLHLTASALVVDPVRRRVLLRWHERQRRWLQVGGHADANDSGALSAALREAREETGLEDLSLVGPGLVHVAVVDVLAGRGEPAHRHGDLRYVLATATPETAEPEDDVAALRWVSFGEALEVAGADSLRVLVERAERLL